MVIYIYGESMDNVWYILVYIYIYLVGGDWNMTFIFPETARNVIMPTDELIFFRFVETTNPMVTVT